MKCEVFTITFNPSIDYLVECKDEITNGINTFDTKNFFVGGKGINVSRVLNNFGVKSKALGFVGGFTGSFIKDTLDKQGILQGFTEIPDDTRINLKVKGTNVEFKGTGEEITDEYFQNFLNNLDTVENKKKKKKRQN